MPKSTEFRVIVTGDVLPEKSRADVLQALARLFHSTPQAMQRLLVGKPVALTKAYSRAQAENICRAIRAAGADCRMEGVAAGDEFDDSAAPGDPGDIDTRCADAGDSAGESQDRPAPRAATGKKERAGAKDNAGDKTTGGSQDQTAGDAPAARAAPEAAERHAALLHFVGVNIVYYQRQFAKFGAIDRPKFALSWHWPAFFAFFLWAAYRKLWQWAAAHLLGGLFLVLTFDPGPVYLAWAALWPLIANYLYYRHACRRLFGEGGVLDDAMYGGADDAGGAAEVDRDAFLAAAEAAGGVSRAAVAAGMLLVLLSSMAFNHLITERVLQRAGTTGISGGGSELLPGAALQRGDGASLDNAALSPRATRTVATLNVIAKAMKVAASSQALDDPELALSVVRRIVEQKRFADGWGTAIAVRRDASGQVALVSAGPDRAFDTADDILRYIDFSAL